MPDKISFSDLRAANSARAVEWSKPLGSGTAEILFRSNELGGETGEALNVVKKYVRYTSGVAGGVNAEESRAALAEELADVVICADRVAEYFGINLAEAVAEKFNKTSDKHGFKTHL